MASPRGVVFGEHSDTVVFDVRGVLVEVGIGMEERMLNANGDKEA